MTKLGRICCGLMAGTSLAAMAISSPGLAAPFSEALKAATVAPAAASTDFQVFLPLRNTAQLDQLLSDQQNKASPNYQKWLTPAQFAAQFGPTQASMSKVQAALQSAGFQITGTGTQSIHVSGTVAQVNKTFQTQLKVVTADGATPHMVSMAAPTLPVALQQEGAKVLAFGAMAPKHSYASKTAAVPTSRRGPNGFYWYNDMKQAYDYPSYATILPSGKRLDGTGVKTGVLISDLLFPGDLNNFFNHEKFSTTTGLPNPTLTVVTIDGGGVVNGPGSFEASLDVQQILGGAPGSALTMVSIPDLYDNHIMDGYTYMIDNPSSFDVVDSSFGGCEATYGPAYNGGVDYTYVLKQYDAIFAQGNAEGITFSASSGDEGGPACPSVSYFTGVGKAVFQKGVSTPSGSIYVTSVGGGNLQTAYTPGSLDSTYVGENGFGDPEIPYDIYGFGETVSGGYWGAGGGQSTIVARPPYQALTGTGTTMRAQPDVGMQVGGCPNGEAYTPCGPNRSAAITAYGGGFYGVIGTSVSSPEFVGAVALYIESVGHKIGNINPYLYSKGNAQTAAGGVNAPAASQFYHRNIAGFDGAWPSAYPSANYNYIYGNGSPDVRKLFGFTTAAAAGVPETASNP